MNKRKIVTLAVFVMVLIVLIFAVSQIILVLASHERSESQQTLIHDGPWSMEAIWRDENSSLYLISAKNDSIPDYYNVMAYIEVDNEWYTAQFNLRQNSTVVSLDSIDGDTYLTATAEMKNGSLLLKDINRLSDNILPESDEILLSVTLVEDPLPFEIQN